MKNKRKLNLKKIEIAKLNVIRGGIANAPFRDRPLLPSIGCGPGTQGLACQYSQTPLSCQVCVEIEN